MILFGINVFLSAFLLFQIELIIANFYLPIYGGSYAVWGSCVVFFQTVLLFGYFFAKTAPEKMGIEKYRYIHLGLLLLPLLFFPGKPIKIFTFAEGLPITFNVFCQLFLNIGAVFFVLSFLTIISQVWFSCSNLKGKANPYVLFSISNLGSFGSLLSYPFFFEAKFGVQQQILFWRIGYFVLIGINLIIVLFVKVTNQEKSAPQEQEVIPRKTVLHWLLLSAAGVALFLSVTNIITLEIAPMPLLWVIPLSIYLISFTLNFKKNPWCPAWIVDKIHIFIGLSILLFFLGQKRILPFLLTAFAYFFLLFVMCMFCQRELYRTKPNSSRLGFFYVMNALCGFLGGVFVSWVVPLISNSLLEFLYSLLFIALAMTITEGGRRIRPLDWGLLIMMLVTLWIWPQVFNRYSLLGILFLFAIFIFISHRFKEKYLIIVLSIIFVMGLKPYIGYYWRVREFFFSHRNYYGIYHIYDEKNTRYLLHGQIIHGLQNLPPKDEMEPLLYYHRQSSFGEVFTAPQFDFKRVGIIGLGVGVLAAYTQPHQEYDFYELDIDDYKIAQTYFTFINKAKGTLKHIIGDARITIQNSPKNSYDLIVVDAFTGDSIPTHLVTKEAVETYRAQLKEDGMIFFHISNRYLRLGPVLAKIAVELDAHFAWQKKIPDTTKIFPATCVVMTWDKEKYDVMIEELKWKQIKRDVADKQRLWTDDYSNILSIFKLNKAFDKLIKFNYLKW